jgi:hypothetical protein
MAFKSTKGFALPPTNTCPHIGARPGQVTRQVLSAVKVGGCVHVKEDGDGILLTIAIDPEADDTIRVVDNKLVFQGPRLGKENVFTGENTFTVVEANEVNATELNILSDRRCKTDIDRLTDVVDEVELVQMLHQLKSYRYRLLLPETGNPKNGNLQLGVMADEFKTAMAPILDTEPGDGGIDENDAGTQRMRVNYNHVLMVVLQNVQLLEMRVRDLEHRLLIGRTGCSP